jgi:hypothetical protein
VMPLASRLAQPRRRHLWTPPPRAGAGGEAHHRSAGDTAGIRRPLSWRYRGQPPGSISPPLTRRLLTTDSVCDRMPAAHHSRAECLVACHKTSSPNGAPTSAPGLRRGLRLDDSLGMRWSPLCPEVGGKRDRGASARTSGSARRSSGARRFACQVQGVRDPMAPPARSSASGRA